MRLIRTDDMTVMRIRVVVVLSLLISSFLAFHQPVAAATNTTINFTLNTSGTIGSIGVDAIYNGAGGGAASSPKSSNGSGCSGTCGSVVLDQESDWLARPSSHA